MKALKGSDLSSNKFLAQLAWVPSPWRTAVFLMLCSHPITQWPPLPSFDSHKIYCFYFVNKQKLRQERGSMFPTRETLQKPFQEAMQKQEGCVEPTEESDWIKEAWISWVDWLTCKRLSQGWKPLIGSICQFLQSKYLHRGQLQATHVMSLNIELELCASLKLSSQSKPAPARQCTCKFFSLGPNILLAWAYRSLTFSVISLLWNTCQSLQVSDEMMQVETL